MQTVRPRNVPAAFFSEVASFSEGGCFEVVDLHRPVSFFSAGVDLSLEDGAPLSAVELVRRHRLHRNRH
jgi:hypothetical protein